MQSHTQFALLSQHALNLKHGRLLRDSGFTKLGSAPSSFDNWALTSTDPQVGSFYQSRTVTGRWSSGRPAMSNIPKAGLSTSAHQSRANESTASILRAIRLAIEKVRDCPPAPPCPTFLPRTSYLRLRWELLALGLDMPSWVQCSDPTPSHDYSALEQRLSSGSILMVQARQLGRQSLNSLLWWAYQHHQLSPAKTPSDTALKKSED